MNAKKKKQKLDLSGLGGRARGTLARMGVSTYGDLPSNDSRIVKSFMAKMEKLRNCGPKTILEVCLFISNKMDEKV